MNRLCRTFLALPPVHALHTQHLKKKSAVHALNKLRNVAYFLNEGWKRRITDSGFFITPNTQLEHSIEGKKYGWAILKHVNVKYPGVIYFKSKEIAERALDIAYKEGWLNDLR